MREQSGFVELPGRGVYCTAFLPDVVASRGVVLVEPLGEEKRGACRMLVRLGRRLAEAGVATMRFDLSGTGDSTLDHGKATLDIWCEDTAAVLRELSQLSGCGGLSLVCARAGALIGARVAVDWAGSPPLEKLVLVEPWLEGKDYLTDLERRQSIKSIMSGGAGESGSASDQWARGEAVDFGGYGFGGELAGGLSSVSVGELMKRFHGTEVSGIRVSASKRLPPAWSVLGDAVTLVVDKPFWGQLDYYESDLVNDAILSRLGI